MLKVYKLEKHYQDHMLSSNPAKDEDLDINLSSGEEEKEFKSGHNSSNVGNLINC
jgi:hypothetical protein